MNENIWDAETKTLIERYFIVDAETGHINEYTSSMQAYTISEYRNLLEDCGFTDIMIRPALFGMENHLFCSITLTGKKH